LGSIWSSVLPQLTRHAVTDQLLRASESFVLNLAEGARLRSAAKRQHVLDYAIGSALECAACLDIAQIKEFLCPDETLQEKSSLCEVVKMMVGLSPKRVRISKWRGRWA
jgi:four helix bundle protein